MENSSAKGQNNGNTVTIKMPKNIRQVGNVLYHGRVIYVEDYVMTFLKQLADTDPGELRAAVFLGYSVKTEEAKNVFIKGAVEMRNTDFSTGITLSDDGWTSVYENIKKYFTDVEIMGWALIGPGFYLESNDKIRKVHTDNFSGNDKVLLKMDSMERDEAFYFCESNQLIKQPGYYIYYEKNEEMQNYMIENKEEQTIREEAVYSDQTTKKIRSIIQEKKEVKEDRSVVRLLYAASSLLAIIVLVIAATMLDNYDRMKKMESALSTISQNINTASKDDSENDDKNTDIQTAGKNDETKTTDESAKNDDEGIIVDTVEGKVTPEPEETKPTEVADNSETDTTKNQGEDKDTDKNTDKNTDKSDTKKDTEKNNGKNSDTSVVDNSDKKDAESDTDSEPASSNATVRYYTVKAGDSLASISFKLYDTYAYMDKIKELNDIEDENKIMAGQKLIVP
ncbi:LysM peptidoglycan-binding domain-containing protein [Anaerocolumna sp. AGMB13020]|uniref:LysM peptidoglycan-binding domain-containing protein n=1 Tax=Anaerocolumna sp. AGMB13020 TaxID=3081750 RepID=UPI0029557121|nr:LysM peptidoglycan-binding domain-containing protein [Anaerocolumna sp. AGMB13020]WOO39101.1 LysM peptidoglycan-binding domain-containing protein [Anaerocolumna sp. AGMB13020]